jgi:hypothetical protein
VQERAPPGGVPEEALMLTGDENFDLAAVYGEW